MPARAHRDTRCSELVELLRAHRATRRVGLDRRRPARCRPRRGTAAPGAPSPRCRRGSRRRSAPAPARGANTLVVAAQLLDVAHVVGVHQQLRPVRAARDAPALAPGGLERDRPARSPSSLSTWVCSSCRCSERRKLAGSRRIAMIRAVRLQPRAIRAGGGARESGRTRRPRRRAARARAASNSARYSSSVVRAAGRPRRLKARRMSLAKNHGSFSSGM